MFYYHESKLSPTDEVKTQLAYLSELILPLIGLIGGIAIVVYVLRTNTKSSAMPFLMLLSGALVATFSPIVLSRLMVLSEDLGFRLLCRMWRFFHSPLATRADKRNSSRSEPT